jgi:hypothetical protein
MTVLDVNFLSFLEKTDELSDFFQINMNIFKKIVLEYVLCVTLSGIYRDLVKF